MAHFQKAFRCWRGNETQTVPNAGGASCRPEPDGHKLHLLHKSLPCAQLRSCTAGAAARITDTSYGFIQMRGHACAHVIVRFNLLCTVCLIVQESENKLVIQI